MAARASKTPPSLRDTSPTAPQHGRKIKEKAEKTNDTYEMRKSGSIGVISSVVNCGYSADTLESLRRAGWSLYKNGTLVVRGSRVKR